MARKKNGKNQSISSTNQSGGITAGVVNVHGSINSTTPEPKEKKTLWFWIAVTASLATIVGVYYQLNPIEKETNAPINIKADSIPFKTDSIHHAVKPIKKNMLDQKKNSDNVIITSNNQSGGITAHTVNINPALKPRHVADIIDLDSLIKVFTKEEEIQISSTFGDSEANNLAKELTQFLRSKNYNVTIDSPWTVYPENPMKPGIGIYWLHPGKVGRAIEVGPNN